VTRLQLGCLALVIAGALPLTATLRPVTPPPSVSVMDWADLLGPRARTAIAEYRDRLREDHDIDYRLVTARGAGDASWASREAFAALGVGERSDSGRGLLLVVDPSTDRVRLEVAASLEAIYPHAFVADLEQRQMAPFFEQGRVADGVLATTRLIVARAEEAASGETFDPTAGALLGPGGEASPAAGPAADRAKDRPTASRLNHH
jgi:uncharacterized protein